MTRYYNRGVLTFDLKSEFPSDADKGQLAYALDARCVYFFDGSVWIEASFNKSVTSSTTDATPTVVFSYPMYEGKCVKARIQYTAYKTDFTLAASGDLFSTFVRASGGSLVRASGSGNGGIDGIVQGNFPNAEPKPDLVANTTTNNIDVTLTGKSSTNITWQLKLTFLPYS